MTTLLVIMLYLLEAHFAFIPFVQALSTPPNLFQASRGNSALGVLDAACPKDLRERDITSQLKRDLIVGDHTGALELLSQKRVTLFHVVTLLYDMAKLNRKRTRQGRSPFPTLAATTVLDSSVTCAISSSQVARMAQIVEKSSRAVKAVDIGMALYGIGGVLGSQDCGPDSPVSTLIDALATKVGVCSECLSARELGMAMYGLRHLSASSAPVRRLLSALALHVDQSPPTSRLDSQAIGNCLYGLQSMSDSVLEVAALLRSLAPRIAASRCRLSAQNVGNALYGLQNVHDAGLILPALNPLIRSCNETLSSQEVSNALYGLKCMSSNDQHVRQLLETLADKLEACPDPFKAQEISNAFFGLQKMSSCDAVVRRVVGFLALRLDTCEDMLGNHSVGNLFYGLRGLSNAHKEVRDLIPVLGRKLSASNAELDSTAMGNVIYGLHRIGNHHSEVNALLDVLALKVGSSSFAFDAKAVGSALYGLSSMSTEGSGSEAGSALLRLVSVLAGKVEACKETLCSHEMGSAMLGLKGLESSRPEVSRLVAALTAKLVDCASLDAQAIGNGLLSLQSMSTEPEVLALLNALHPHLRQTHHLLSLQQLGNSLYGMQGLSFDADDAIVAETVLLLLSTLGDATSGDLNVCDREGLVTAVQSLAILLMTMDSLPSAEAALALNIQTKIVAHLELHPVDLGFKSAAEKLAYETVQRMIAESSSRLKLQANTFLHGFEADIVVRRVDDASDNDWKTLNIEVDGPNHLFHHSRRFCSLRDRYLGTRGVRVIRCDDVSGLEESLAASGSFES